MRIKNIVLSAVLLPLLVLFPLSSRCDESTTVSVALSLGEIYAENSRYVGRVMAEESESSDIIYIGTGFVIDESGLFVTAAHVLSVDEGGRLVKSVVLATGPMKSRTIHEAEILKVDMVHDIALLRLAGQFPGCVKVDYEYESVAGDMVFTIGYPTGFPGILSEGMIASDQPVSVKTDNWNAMYDDVVPTTLYLTGGNSGGPVFNKYGRVIGVATAGTDGPRSVFQKIKYLRRLLNDRSNRVVIVKGPIRKKD